MFEKYLIFSNLKHNYICIHVKFQQNDEVFAFLGL